MKLAVLAVILAAMVMILLSLMNDRFGPVRRSYYYGVEAWSQWLPVFSTLAYLFLLMASLIRLPFVGDEFLDIGRFFSDMEIGLFLCAGPLFLTRFGNLAALSVLLWVLQTILVAPELPQGLGMLILTSSLTFVVFLADRQPWSRLVNSSRIYLVLREFVVITMAILAMALAVSSMFKAYPLVKWIELKTGLEVAPSLAVAALGILFSGWMAVALGYTRHYSLLVLSLPTIFALHYMSNFNSTVLAIPFSAVLALALCAADRRKLRTEPTYI